MPDFGHCKSGNVYIDGKANVTCLPTGRHATYDGRLYPPSGTLHATSGQLELKWGDRFDNPTYYTA